MAAVAALGAVVIALVAVIFIWAAYQLLRPLIDHLLGLLPGVGAWITAREEDLLFGFLQATAVWAHTAMVPLGDLFRRLERVPREYLAARAALDQATVGLLQRITGQDLPRLASGARAYTDQAASRLEAEQAAELLRAEGYADAITATARGQLETEIQAVGQFAEAKAGEARAAGLAAAAGAVQHADDLAGREAAERAAAVGGIESGLRNLAAQAAEQVRGLGLEVARQRLADLAGIENDLAGTASSDRAYADARAGAAAAAGIAAASVVAKAVRTLEQSRCLQRCDTLGALGEAIELIDLGLIFGLLVQASKDPAAASDSVRREVVPLVVDLEAGARALLGLGT